MALPETDHSTETWTVAATRRFNFFEKRAKTRPRNVSILPKNFFQPDYTTRLSTRKSHFQLKKLSFERRSLTRMNNSHTVRNTPNRVSRWRRISLNFDKKSGLGKVFPIDFAGFYATLSQNECALIRFRPENTGSCKQVLQNVNFSPVSTFELRMLSSGPFGLSHQPY